MGELKTIGHYNVIGVDLKNHKNTNNVITPDVAQQVINKAAVAIVLTGKGSDFFQYKQYLNQNCIIIDDTHPKIKKGFEKFVIYKVAVGIPGTKFFPRLPGYKSNWIPGCTAEAIIASATGHFNKLPQNEFNQLAKSLGFFAHMVR
jgi:hypothetical protein